MKVIFSSLWQSANYFVSQKRLQGTRPSSVERKLLPFVASPLLCKGYEKGPPKRTTKHSLAKVLSWHRNGIYNVEGSVNSAPLYPEEVRFRHDNVFLSISFFMSCFATTAAYGKRLICRDHRQAMFLRQGIIHPQPQNLIAQAPKLRGPSHLCGRRPEG